jgi:hypothetical protein
MKEFKGWKFPGETKKNDTGNVTRMWQDRLVESGYLPHTSGLHDADTAEAFKKLREDLGYEVPTEEVDGKSKPTEAATGGTEGLWKAYAKSDL